MFEVPSVDIVTHSGQEHIAISGRANNAETAMDIIDEELSAFKNGGMDQRKLKGKEKGFSARSSVYRMTAGRR